MGSKKQKTRVNTTSHGFFLAACGVGGHFERARI
jgi:hypothetical protein